MSGRNPKTAHIEAAEAKAFREWKALVTRDRVVEAMQTAWDTFCHDTGCFPDCLTLERGEITARFDVGTFASAVTTHLRDEIDRARGEGGAP